MIKNHYFLGNVKEIHTWGFLKITLYDQIEQITDSIKFGKSKDWEIFRLQNTNQTWNISNCAQ